MRKLYIFFAFIFLFAILGSFMYKEYLFRGDADRALTTAGNFERIISLSPSITETLFALGLGEKVVGVTRFCTYPPEADRLPEVGGYLDPNYEAIAVLKPDLVFIRPEHEDEEDYLEAMNISVVTVENRNIEDILECIDIIGTTCGVRGRSQALRDSILSVMDEIAERTKGLERPSVMLTVGRPLGEGTIREVFAAGAHTLYDEMIRMAGGKNVLSGSALDYPELSSEGILSLNPDIVVELVPVSDERNASREEILNDWMSIRSAKAVRENTVYIIDADYAAIPGPRFIRLLKDLAGIIHPEIEWGKN